MPRRPHFPVTCAECKTLSLARLRAAGLLQPGFHATTLTWDGKDGTQRIQIEVNLEPDTAPYLRVRYDHHGVPCDYRIALEALPSNLPGREYCPGRYRLRCPVSGKPGAVLYLRRGTFAHRLAYPDERLYYDSQLTPKWLRPLASPGTLERQLAAACEALGEPGRKAYYRGRPTRWFARLRDLERQLRRRLEEKNKLSRPRTAR